MSDLGDSIERLCAHPAALIVFVVCVSVGPFINLDATNYAISVFTAGLLLLTLGGTRRSTKATHAKLDDLVDAIPDAPSEHTRLEERTEQEIEDARQ